MKPEIPVGKLHLNTILTPISFNWTALPNLSGATENYVMTCTPLVDLQPCGKDEGLETSASIWNLVPATKYCFYVQP